MVIWLQPGINKTFINIKETRLAIKLILNKTLVTKCSSDILAQKDLSTIIQCEYNVK